MEKQIAQEPDVIFADKDRDKAQIEELWNVCFGDDKEYVDFYMEHRMTQDNMLAVFIDGKMVSMASMLPAEYQMENEMIRARYVYAVATLPQYRNRGLAAKILDAAKKIYREPLFLEPASEKLCSYYEKLGFAKAFHASDGLNEWIPAPEAKYKEFPETGILQDNCAEQWKTAEQIVKEQQVEWYQQLRDTHFQKDGYVRWDREAISYALEENSYCGGEVRFFFKENREHPEDFLMYQKHENQLEVLETTLSGSRREEACSRLCGETHTVCYRNRTHAGMIWLPEGQKAKLPEQGYLNLTLG